MAPKAHRPSAIDRMPKAIQNEVRRLRVVEGRHIDEIVAKLQELGHPASRSSVGRHVKSLEELSRIGREVAEIGDAMGGDGAGETADKLAAANNQMAQAIIFRLNLAALDGENASMAPAEVLNLTRSLSALSTGRKADAERLRKEREAAKLEFMASVEKVAAAGGSGLTRATVDAIRHAVLGGEA